jgi:hypothetical protein
MLGEAGATLGDVTDPLLCELHAHTTWSDGVLSVRELADVYGTAGFDVLCVTDHTVRLDDPSPRAVDGWSWPPISTRSSARQSAHGTCTTWC